MRTQDWTAIDHRARAVLAAHDGIVHVSGFDAAGFTRYQVAALFRRGVLERPRIGWYVDPELPWQVKRAVRVGGIACCVTAAALWGLPVPPGAHERQHVLVDEHDSRLRHGRDRSWVLESVDDDDEVEVHWGVTREEPESGRTSLLDTLLMLSACVPVSWFVAAVDAALHVPRGGIAMLEAEDYARLSDCMPRRTRRLLRHVDPSAESCIETLLRIGLLARGFGPVVPQAIIGLLRVDFLVEGVLVVEADGAAFHDAERDRVRDDLLRSLGYRVLRFSYERIVSELDAVLDEIAIELATDA